ncbi:Hypothetical predicted protein [Octopus vulgaris]|uniref:Uncharacterized protein n=1 Tax=Octopus vulgaris TaxID=6645 RepID=A0AA36B348_OCTVU|nr:Hypothetical predicted protein [Octopus vulgaris]
MKQYYNKCTQNTEMVLMATTRRHQEKLHPNIQDNVIPVVSRIAQDKGCEVIFSPSNYSDLQLIEAVWGGIKEEVVRKVLMNITYDIISLIMELPNALLTIAPMHYVLVLLVTIIAKLNRKIIKSARGVKNNNNIVNASINPNIENNINGDVGIRNNSTNTSNMYNRDCDSEVYNITGITDTMPVTMSGELNCIAYVIALTIVNTEAVHFSFVVGSSVVSCSVSSRYLRIE